MRTGALSELAGSSGTIVSPLGVYTKKDLLRIATLDSRKFSGLRIGLHLADAAHTLAALLALDQCAALVCLLPTSSTNATLQHVAQMCQLDILVSDRTELSEALEDFTVVRRLEDIPCSDTCAIPSTDTKWIFLTSGTSGMPKAVGHTLASLTRTTKKEQPCHSKAVWGLLYDHMRFAGMQVVLQAFRSGAVLVAPPVDFPLDERLAFLQQHGCTHLSATPTLWRLIIMSDAGRKLKLQQVTLGGEIADGRLLWALRDAYPAARISHIYASTEAGVGFSVSDGKPGFPVSWLSNPPSGIRIRVVDGCLYVMNPLVSETYLNVRDTIRDLEGWVNTGDLVEVIDDRVYFRGRANGMINVGGDKVLPEEVEQVLLSHPAVAAARVYALPSPIVGSLIAADIVLRAPADNGQDMRQVLRGYCSDRLARFKVPMNFKIVPGFDIGATGKIRRASVV